MFDIPLLFEGRYHRYVDIIVTVTACEAVQRSRVLSRHGMSEEKMAAIIARQIGDSEKRRRSHFIIKTDEGFLPARRQIKTIIAAIAYCG